MFSSKRARLAHEKLQAAIEASPVRPGCLDTDPDIFFMEGNESWAPAKKICAQCPVRNLCLEYALEQGEFYGMFGGMSPSERWRLQGNTNRFQPK